MCDSEERKVTLIICATIVMIVVSAMISITTYKVSKNDSICKLLTSGVDPRAAVLFNETDFQTRMAFILTTDPKKE